MHLRTTITILLAAVAFVAGPALAQEPTLHEVYQAAQSGNMSEAQRMMKEVLRAHPDSAKAHYVEAELLAKQGQLAAAATELNTAERLEPGLSFAKPEAVRELKARVASSSRGFGQSLIPASQAGAGGGIPWGMLLVGAAIVGLVIFGIRAMSRRSATAAYTPGMQPYNPSAPAQPAGTPAPAPGGTGIGSGILGGLATGAAIGAGIVAGEALAHRLGGGQGHDASAQPLDADRPSDMGGNDFGVADNSSWDDGLGGVDGGGGSDWT
ncbi:MAG TPA: tetratricopeptide repeat protein [Casimicrobiaceae bacterium]|nr:tetratricopeptide repeat protein [Casimicrobiaceae bacterium]